MEPGRIPSSHPSTDPKQALRRHGFTESWDEELLRQVPALAATLCGTPMALLILADEGGIWFRSDLGVDQVDPGLLMELAGLAVDEVPGRVVRDQPKDGPIRFAACVGLGLGDETDLGSLVAMDQTPRSLTNSQSEALAMLGRQVSAMVLARRNQGERRQSPRGPSGSSFVPGLIHELRNFMFGISANLDVFDARYAGEPDARKYGAVIRTSMNRLGSFIEELQDYGDPKRLLWHERSLEPVLREALRANRPIALTKHIELVEDLPASLPRLRCDEDGLLRAFSRLVELVILQEQPGAKVLLRAERGNLQDRPWILGTLESPTFNFEDHEVSRLFEPFYLRSHGQNRLGLPVARRILESHGGNLSAHNLEGGGLRLAFALPGRPD